MKPQAETRIFTLFSLVGVAFAILVIALNGVAIDILGFDPSTSSAIVILSLFILKYVCLRWLGLIVASLGSYTVGNLFVTLVSIVAISMLIELCGISGSVATSSVIGLSFVLRYMLLRELGVIRLERVESARNHGAAKKVNGDRK